MPHFSLAYWASSLKAASAPLAAGEWHKGMKGINAQAGTLHMSSAHALTEEKEARIFPFGPASSREPDAAAAQRPKWHANCYTQQQARLRRCPDEENRLWTSEESR